MIDAGGINHEIGCRFEAGAGQEARHSVGTAVAGGTASAVVVACILTGRTERKVLVHLPGGDLNIEWRESDNNVYMTGPATEVFSGEWNE